MNTDSKRFALRLPADLYDRLSKAATTSGRSVNAEIIHRLSESFEYVDLQPEVIQEMFSRITRIEQAQREMADLGEKIQAATQEQHEKRARGVKEGQAANRAAKKAKSA